MLPCFQHSISHSSSQTVPSLRDTSAWLHVSAIAYSESTMRTTQTRWAAPVESGRSKRSADDGGGGVREDVAWQGEVPGVPDDVLSLLGRNPGAVRGRCRRLARVSRDDQDARRR